MKLANAGHRRFQNEKEQQNGIFCAFPRKAVCDSKPNQDIHDAGWLERQFICYILGRSDNATGKARAFRIYYCMGFLVRGRNSDYEWKETQKRIVDENIKAQNYILHADTYLSNLEGHRSRNELPR